MKGLRRAFYLLFVLLGFLLPQSHVKGVNWYTGAERIQPADGITANISTPQYPLALIQNGESGESNWVSTSYVDVNGKDWIQAGWLIYWYQNTPQQYVEWCIDCDGIYGNHFISPYYAFHDWGTTHDYWVYRVYQGITNTRWCGATGGYERYCANSLHSTSVNVLALSEIHAYSKNSLDTTFSQVKYLDPTTRFWMPINNVSWAYDFPYAVYPFADDHFWNFRLLTYDAVLPIVIK